MSEQQKRETAAAIRTLEIRASINRGDRQPTIADHRAKLRTIEDRGRSVDAELTRLQKLSH